MLRATSPGRGIADMAGVKGGGADGYAAQLCQRPRLWPLGMQVVCLRDAASLQSITSLTTMSREAKPGRALSKHCRVQGRPSMRRLQTQNGSPAVPLGCARQWRP